VEATLDRPLLLAIPSRGSSFLALDQGPAPHRFSHEVLRVGRFFHPRTGSPLDFDRAGLEKIASATNRWIALGHKVFFPDGHTSDASRNLGFWSNFRVDGDRLLADVSVEDEDVLPKIGKTIQDVSALILKDALASSGERFEHVIAHVAATPEPVIPGQGNFEVRLAREAEGGPVVEKPAPIAPAPAPAAPACTCGAEKKSLELSRELDTVKRENGELKLAVDALRQAETTRKKREGETLVSDLRRRAVELGSPIPEDDLRRVAQALDRGDGETARVLSDAFLSRSRAIGGSYGHEVKLDGPRRGSELQERLLAGMKK
jgi:hypothetical protein